MTEPPAVTVVGEALVDLVPGVASRSYLAQPGGSPYNVAIALARLQVPTALLARLGDDAMGRLLRDHAAVEGVDLAAAPHAAEPAALAVVSLDAAGDAHYDFYLDGTAALRWRDGELEGVPAGTSALHFGSLASWLPDGDARIRATAARLRETGEVLVSYDPNIRPGLIGPREAACATVERAVATAHLVKASADEIGWLYPDVPVDQVASRWLALGPAVVVVTRAGEGASAFRAGGTRIDRPARPVAVADTVGAGDSYMAGLLAALARSDRLGPDAVASMDDDAVAEVMDFAARVAAVTCSRPGADPPRLSEVAAPG